MELSLRRPAEVVHGTALDEFTFVRVPARTFGDGEDDDAYSDDADHSYDGEEDDGPSMLFIDSGNNKDSPAQPLGHAGKPMILASSGGGAGSVGGGSSYDETSSVVSGADMEGGNGSRRASKGNSRSSLGGPKADGLLKKVTEEYIDEDI